jgi:hypothetical protein
VGKLYGPDTTKAHNWRAKKEKACTKQAPKHVAQITK